MKQLILVLPFLSLFVAILLPHAFAQSGQYEVTIRYSANSVSGVSEVFAAVHGAPIDQEYLVLTLQITNNVYGGYNGGFYVNPAAFYVTINQVEYRCNSSTYSLQDPLPVVTLQPGGSITGQILFQVPGSYGITPSYTPTYQFEGATPNINWVQS